MDKQKSTNEWIREAEKALRECDKAIERADRAIERNKQIRKGTVIVRKSLNG